MNVSFIAIITFLVASCAQTLGETVLELAEKLGTKTLVKLVTEGELTDTLSGPGPFTLFAPNDAAFAALPKDTYDRLTKDKRMLKSVLQYHVLSGNLFSSEMRNDLMPTTLSMNMKVRVNVYNKIVTVDGNKVVLTDQNATNGVIHMIDKVLYQLPKQNILQFAASNTDFSQLTYAVTKAKLEMSFAGGPFTLFAPTNEAFNKLPPETLNKLLHDEAALKGYSLTPCSYPNNLSSNPLRTCSMHSPLRIKIQNAINKALQLETTDVLFVGGRRRNRKRKRKHGKDKRKSKKYEGKETPVLKAKTHNGNEGRYIALLAEDDISLSPSMIDDLLDGTTSIDVISINQGDEGDEQEEECAFDDENDNTKETKEETSEIDVKEKKNLQKEEIDADCTELTNDEERPSSCDTGYNSEEEHKISEDTVISTDEIKDEEHMEEIMVDDDDVFVGEDEDSELDNSTFVPEKEITKDEGIVLTKPDIFEDVSLENENNEGIEENADLDQTTSDKEVIEEEEEDLKEESSDLEIKEDTLKAEIVCPSEKFSVEDLYTEEPRVTINFDCEEEEEEEIYTKQPKPWYSSKTEEDEERRPLICCGDDNGVGYACCTIL